jgi:hypothetical protein
LPSSIVRTKDVEALEAVGLGYFAALMVIDEEFFEA